MNRDPHAELAQPPAPKKLRIVPVGIALLVLAVCLLGGFLLHRSEASVNNVALADEPRGVTVVKALPTTFREQRRYIGTFEPWQTAQVGPQLVAAFVDTVLVRPGSKVKRGEVIATLDCRHTSAESRMVAARARALEERRRASASEAARMGELLHGGYVSPNEVEQKLATVSSEQAELQALLAQAAGKGLQVDDCVLRAPFEGEVSERFVDPGCFVRPGMPIATIVDRSVVRLSGDVPEIDFAAVAPTTPVRMKLLATGKALDGPIARRSPAADPATRTIHFEVDVHDATRSIPVGTTAEVFLDVGAPLPASEIPLLAAKIRGTSASIFVVEGDTAHKRELTVLGERGASLFIGREQLQPGTSVVTQGRQLLATNDKVAPKLEDVKAAAGGAKSL